MARPSPPSHLELASTGTVRRSLTFGSVSAGRLTGGALLRQVALLALLIVTAGFWIYFSVAASGFTSDFNLFSLLRFAAIQITIGFAQMVALSIGDMNLAVGAIGGATGMIAGWVMQVLGLPPEVAVLFALVVGLVLGFGNALLITWTRINSFIVTLATASLITGAMLILTHAHPFSLLPDSFTSFSEVEVAGLPVSPLVVVMLVVAAALFFLYRNLSLGREMLAVGANRQAARVSGLSVDRVVVSTHGPSGALAATAGLMAISADHTASPGLAVGLLVIDVVGMLVLSVVTPSFLSTYTLFVTGRDLSILLLVALAQMVVLSLGQMNLSIGSIGGLVAIIESGLMVRYGFPVPIALAAGLVLGIVCGVINGLLVYWTKINSFVLTLVTSYVFAGINLGITHATPFYHIPNAISSFGQIGRAHV